MCFFFLFSSFHIFIFALQTEIPILRRSRCPRLGASRDCFRRKSCTLIQDGRAALEQPVQTVRHESIIHLSDYFSDSFACVGAFYVARVFVLTCRFGHAYFQSAKSLEVVLEAVIRKLLTEEDIDESKVTQFPNVHVKLPCHPPFCSKAEICVLFGLSCLRTMTCQLQNSRFLYNSMCL